MMGMISNAREGSTNHQSITQPWLCIHPSRHGWKGADPSLGGRKTQQEKTDQASKPSAGLGEIPVPIPSLLGWDGGG